MPVGDEFKLSNGTELLLRQIHPNMVQEGRPTSLAFRPNGNDAGRLSSDRGSMLTPRVAFEAYLARQRQTAGTWAISVAEYSQAGLASYSDPIEENIAHAIIDFTTKAQTEWRSLSKRFQVHSTNRGILYPQRDETV